MFNWLTTAWDDVKLWFKNSETIFLARLEAFVGFIVMALSGLDWSPLLSMGIDTGFSWAQATWLGGIMLAKGLIGEWARRANTIELAGHLVPTTKVLAIAKEEVKTEVTKVVKKAKKQADVA